jgi:pilus assembly protein TadC
MLIINPWLALMLSLVTYSVIGFASFYIFLREAMGWIGSACALGAGFILANGFFVEHALVGHVGFQHFPLLGVILFLAFTKRLAFLPAGILIGLLTALIVNQAGFIVLIIFSLSVLILLPLIYLIRPELFKPKLFATLLSGGLFAALLSVSKISAVIAFLLVALPVLMRPNLLLALLAAVLGYVVPAMVLARLAKRRGPRIRLSLADGLDLLVVSVEAGLGLDQAMLRVGEELGHAHPDLSEEMRLVNLELRAGKDRVEALRNLGERTDVDDVVSLVAILVQTDKFGTSVAQALRVHSDTLRTKRRQRAEEAAAKTGVKMVFPLVFCIFPSIYVVTLGPAAIKIIEMFAKMNSR